MILRGVPCSQSVRQVRDGKSWVQINLVQFIGKYTLLQKFAKICFFFSIRKSFHIIHLGLHPFHLTKYSVLPFLNLEMEKKVLKDGEGNDDHDDSDDDYEHNHDYD